MQKDAFARQTAILSDLVSKAKGEETSPADALGIADRAYAEVRKVVARDETTVTPVRGQELSRVLAKCLFVSVDTSAAALAAETYTEMYQRTALLLPEQARQASYRERMIAHYPFHPTLIDWLNDKLALIFRLQDRIKDLDRVELIAHRVSQFTREEAVYWLSRTTSFGPTANRWAISGLRTMLGGHADDKGVQQMLERLRLAT